MAIPGLRNESQQLDVLIVRRRFGAFAIRHGGSIESARALSIHSATSIDQRAPEIPSTCAESARCTRPMTVVPANDTRA